MKLPIPKLCFFDMEGTLLAKNYCLDNGKVAPSAWTVLAKEIGEDCYLEEERSKDKWINNQYLSYTSWMYDSIAIQKKHGLNQSVFNKVIESSVIQNGAKCLVDYLHSHGVVTVIISGGFKQLADKTQRSLKVRHAYSACEYFFGNDGFLEHFNLLPTDEYGKFVFMKHLAEEYGAKLSECLFVGDGKNDVFLASNVGYSIAFNAQIELDAVSNIIIKQRRGEEDLSDIIRLFE